MEQKNYLHLIQERVGRRLDFLILLGALTAGMSAIAIHISGIGPKFVIIDAIATGILLLIYMLRNIISGEQKVIFAAIITIVISILTFAEGGFGSGTMTLLIIGNGAAVLFMSKGKSNVVVIFSLIIYVTLWISSYIFTSIVPSPELSVAWIVHILMFGMCILLFRIFVDDIRTYLLENIESLEKAGQLTYHLAYFDQLTGLPNKIRFIEDLENKVCDMEHCGYIVLMSLSNMNMIRSIYGDEMGDNLLVTASKCYLEQSKEREILARITEDNFALWIEAEDKEDMKKRLNELKWFYSNADGLPEVRRRINFDLSVAECNGNNIAACFENAKMALTYAKHHAMSEIVVYDKTFEDKLRHEEQLKEELQRAIYQRNFNLHYQAQIDSRSRKVVGVEALARWDSSIGPIGPSVFVSLIEEMDLAIAFGKMTLEIAFGSFEDLVKLYGKDIKLSVNISPTFLMSHEFASNIFEIANRYDINAQNIVLEITEDVLIKGVDKVNAVLGPMRKCGYHISLDDFGSGYSSLNYLTSIEVDELKIDRSFTSQIISDLRTRHTVQAIFKLCQSLELHVVAEGVESAKELEIFSEMGCYVIQGYFYSKALPLEELREKFNDSNK